MISKLALAYKFIHILHYSHLEVTNQFIRNIFRCRTYRKVLNRAVFTRDPSKQVEIITLKL